MTAAGNHVRCGCRDNPDTHNFDFARGGDALW